MDSEKLFVFFFLNSGSYQNFLRVLMRMIRGEGRLGEAGNGGEN